MKLSPLLAAPALCLALAFPALAAEHEIHMLNKGEAGTMVFEPAFVKAEPGDTSCLPPPRSALRWPSPPLPPSMRSTC